MVSRFLVALDGKSYLNESINFILIHWQLVSETAQDLKKHMLRIK
jgi:hypothetical protein